MQRSHERVTTANRLPADAEMLIREARRLRRRRWAVGVALLLTAGAGVGIGVGTSGGAGQTPAPDFGSRTPADGVAVAPNVKMLSLTKSDKYGDLALAGSRIVLYGPAAQAQDPSASATCNSATVNPTTLALSDLMTSSCANPALEGRRVLPVVTVEPKVPFGSGGAANVTVRISRVVPGSPGYALGPVVMSFPQESDGWPGWTYGGGALWLFDAYAKGGSQLLRISAMTGAVEQRVAMPAISRPIVAVNDEGFWLAPAANSLGNADLAAVYLVAPGASTATRVLVLPDDEYAQWMVASGDLLWLAPGPDATTVWGITGAGAASVHRVTLAPELRGVLMVRGNGSAMVGGASGLWTAVARPSGTQQQVYRLVPSTGAVSSVAVLKPAYSSPSDLIDGNSAEAITYRGAMYLLDPPTPTGPDYQGEGFSALYRITVKPA